MLLYIYNRKDYIKPQNEKQGIAPRFGNGLVSCAIMALSSDHESLRLPRGHDAVATCRASCTSDKRRRAGSDTKPGSSRADDLIALDKTNENMHICTSKTNCGKEI